MDTEQKSSTFQISLSPVQLFAAGIGSGLLVLCAIGFFILLSMYFKGGFSAGGERLNLGTNPSPSAPSQVASVRAVDEKTDHIRGNKNAKVTVIEYSDFECPYCKTFHGTMQQILATYTNDVKWVYRHFPLSFHQNAQKEAEASECLAEQGKFWEFADLIFKETTSNGTGIALDQLPEYARRVGANVAKFNTCLAAGTYAGRVQADEQDGSGAGVGGTPYSFVIGTNGRMQRINGAQPFEAMDAAIKSLL